MKKDTGKRCDFHKTTWNNMNEFRSKKSLMAKLKALGLDLGFNYDSKIYKGKHIIEVGSTATVATTKVHPNYLKEVEKGENLFHSWIWMMGVPLHFIVDSRSQNNLILV